LIVKVSTTLELRHQPPKAGLGAVVTGALVDAHDTNARGKREDGRPGYSSR
jgi:hypothetical protein